MFQKLFSRTKKTTPEGAVSSEPAPSLIFREEGIVMPRLRIEDLSAIQGKERQRAAYLLQLEEEGYLTPIVEDWLLPWEQLFALTGNEEHQASLSLLDLPPEIPLVPILASEGALSDTSFKVVIRGWRKPDGTLLQGALEKEGAVCHIDGLAYLLPFHAWRLVQAVRQFGRAQQDAPGEATNQVGWAQIRKAGQAAGATFDGFLERTVVVRPESLRLKIDKSEQQGLHVLKVTPVLEEQPEGWLRAFDAMQTVPDHYSVASDNGGITHVLISPEVKTVLQEIRSMPGRRVSGDKALQLLRNPYACLGDDANKVLDQEQFELDREAAGFSFLRFKLRPVFTETGGIGSVHMQLESISTNECEAEPFIFSQAGELALFVRELEAKLAAGLSCGFWKGFELELSDFDSAQLESIKILLNRWQKEEGGALFDEVLDLDQYGSRVIGIGEAKIPTSPYLTQTSGEKWLPEALLNDMGLDGALLAKWDTDNPELLAEFQRNIAEARKDGILTVVVPGLEATLPLDTAERLAIAWAAKFKEKEPSDGDPPARPSRSVLLIDDNIEELSYIERRASALRLAVAARPAMPTSLLPDIDLREHQKQGVAWLQHLFQCAPVHASGCLLADDMGLGKTLQLLTFIAWHLEQEERSDPVLIVAPVSLLDNWENELRRFFVPDFAPMLKLYGAALSAAKFHKNQIPDEIKARGIYNLLKPNWLGNARLVLTTYETLRDHEFSLARQQWAIMVCDEAQKIKNPAALVTQAAKAIPARFKVACTGTPVENSLTDLWCLFDFIQPGLLGSLNEFGKQYRQPVEARDEKDLKALDALRALIDPQILRRLKSDVAKDLPAKIESLECKQLPMSSHQQQLYKSEISRFEQKNGLLSHVTGKQSAGILGLLHTMKMICAHPHAVYPIGELMDVSPKMRWLVKELHHIKARSEKVIIFTELRDIQRALQLAVLDHFGLHVTVVNGDTTTSSEKGLSRQKLIDAFQAKPGFGVIILSTTAVGFGVNVQAANHVIHFTRCWNPAKEDQATDRAYRIGQNKDVYVYYPTIMAKEFESFEQKLDKLLTHKRELASDMLNGAGDINVLDLAAST